MDEIKKERYIRTGAYWQYRLVEKIIENEEKKQAVSLVNASAATRVNTVAVRNERKSSPTGYYTRLLAKRKGI